MEMVAAGTNTFKAVDVGVPIGLISVGPTMTLAPESKPVPVMASVTSALAGVLLGLSAITLIAATVGGVVVPGCVVAAPPLLNLYKAAIQALSACGLPGNPAAATSFLKVSSSHGSLAGAVGCNGLGAKAGCWFGGAGEMVVSGISISFKAKVKALKSSTASFIGVSLLLRSP